VFSGRRDWAPRARYTYSDLFHRQPLGQLPKPIYVPGEKRVVTRGVGCFSCWSDGTTHLLLSPLELIEKLAALVPPPRLNLVRYHGLLAPNARQRQQIVPAPPVTVEADVEPTAVASPQARTHRLTWVGTIRYHQFNGASKRTPHS
jgi:hypothetical protein